MTAGNGGSYHGGVKRLFAAVSVNLLSSVIAAVAGLGATAFMARQMSIDEFGRILLLLTVATAFAIFEGQRPVVIHRVAAGTGGSGALFHTAARVNALMVLVTITCLIGALAAGAAADLPLVADIALAVTVVVFFVAMQYWSFLDAEQDTIFTGLIRSICWIFLYLSFSIAAFLGLGLAYYTIALLAMHVLLAGIFWLRFRWLGLAHKYGRENWGEGCDDLLRPAISNIIFNGCAVTINVADRMIVGSILGARPAGLYSGPSELALRAVGLVRAGVQVVLPWAARQSKSDQQRYWLFSVAAILIAVGTGASILLLGREPIAGFLLGPAFLETGDLLGIFGIGIVFSTLGYACIVQFNAHGDFSTQRRLYVVAAIVLVSAAAWGAIEGKLIYVAMAYLLARSVDLALLAILLRRCPVRARLWFSSLAITMALAFGAAWTYNLVATIVFLGISYGLAHAFWRNRSTEEL